MKHGIVYGILILWVLLTGAIPFRGHDIAALRPVKTVFVESDGGQIRITADTGDMGVGGDWASAMADMEKTSTGMIFQGTIACILLENGETLPQILENDTLNPNCVVCRAESGLDLTGAGAYLDIHSPDSSLRQLRAEGTGILPVLVYRDGRYDLENGKG